MDWISRIIIVCAINSAGDSITWEEAETIVAQNGGDPHWVYEPPSWVNDINERAREANRDNVQKSAGGGNERETAFG